MGREGVAYTFDIGGLELRKRDILTDSHYIECKRTLKMLKARKRRLEKMAAAKKRQQTHRRRPK